MTLCTHYMPIMLYNLMLCSDCTIRFVVICIRKVMRQPIRKNICKANVIRMEHFWEWNLGSLLNWEGLRHKKRATVHFKATALFK